MSDFIKKNGIIVNKSFENILSTAGLNNYLDFMHVSDCEPVKIKKSRSVFKFTLKDPSTARGERVFYLKRHNYSGSEKFSSLVSIKGKEDGHNEWLQTIALSEAGFNVMIPVAFGEKKIGPVSVECFTLSEEVYDCDRLSDYIADLPDDAKGLKEKIDILTKLAHLASHFHREGFNHQDFYLVHFFLRQSTDEIFIMDLQRVHKRDVPSTRWVIKDLAQFVFSALSGGCYTHDDLSIFWHEYFDKEKLSTVEEKMIKNILAKAKRIAKHDAKLVARSNK